MRTIEDNKFSKYYCLHKILVRGGNIPIPRAYRINLMVYRNVGNIVINKFIKVKRQLNLAWDYFHKLRTEGPLNPREER